MEPVLLIVSMTVGLLTAYLADKRGRNAFAWFGLGFLFGLLALVVLYLIPSLATAKAADGEGSHTASSNPETLAGEIVEEEPPAYIKFQWYYLDKQRKQQGPVPFRDLLKLWNDREVGSATLVWYEELEDWKRIRELPGLQTVIIEENKKARDSL